MAFDDRQDELDRQEARLDAIDELYQEIKEQRQETWQRYRDTVVEALDELQDEINDPVTLLEVEERGRMDFDYEEVLTPDGVETRGGGYHDWDGSRSPEAYLDSIYRGTGEHVDLLAERLTNLEDEPPAIRYPVNG